VVWVALVVAGEVFFVINLPRADDGVGGTSPLGSYPARFRKPSRRDFFRFLNKAGRILAFAAQHGRIIARAASRVAVPDLTGTLDR
jgi:hypothetical protein